MAITVHHGRDMPAGFVRLGRSNAENLDAATLEIGIATADAGKHLDPSKQGAAVWVSGETWFAPKSSAAEKQGIVLELGPRVTWHLKPKHPYRVHLRDGKGHIAKDRMIWPAVRMPTSSSEPAAQPKPAEPSPTPDLAPAPESAAAPTEVSPTTTASPSEAADTETTKVQERNARSIFRMVAGLMGIYHWIGAAVAIVILALFLQFHKGNIDSFMDSAKGLVDKIIQLVREVDDADVGGEYGGTTTTGTGDDTATSRDGAAAPGVSGAGARAPMTRAEVVPYLKEKPPADDALEEAGRAGDAGDRDAAFLLLKYAAREGSAHAARLIGQLYDPVTHSPDGVIKNADSEIAAGWYEKAAKAGDADAMFRLGEMLKEGMLDRSDASEQSLQWLRKAAEAGSKKAKELLQ